MKWTIVCALWMIGVSLQAQDVVFRAMQDELERSTKKLQLEQLERPYFISYKIVDADSKDVAASLGSLLHSVETRSRFLTVELRVGDYRLDNSNFFSFPFASGGVARMLSGTQEMPLDDNYDELRRQIWLVTDGAYKKALEDLAGKRAVLANMNRPDNIPDFSKEKPSVVSDALPRAEVDLPEAERLTQRLSSVFRQTPAVYTSQVRFRVTNTRERFINSEGTSFTTQAPLVSLQATAATQATDGMPISDFLSTYGRSMKELPPESVIISELRDLGTRLGKLQTAPIEERYSGPVLFEDQAAAEIVAQALAQELPAMPSQVAAQAFSRRENKLLDKIEARILPEFLSLVDDPTAMQADDHVLFARYKIDEEGTTARKTVVVENGVLKTLLTSRASVRGILQSTANLRSQGVAPSNLFLIPQTASSPQQIKAQFIDLVKRRDKSYGIAIRRLQDPAFQSLEGITIMMPRAGQDEKIVPAISAYRIYTDGHEELVRNITLSGVSTQSFRDILSVSNTSIVYTAPFAARAASPFLFARSSTPLLVSYVVPSSLLFEDMSVQSPPGEVPKPPVIGHPFFSK